VEKDASSTSPAKKTEAAKKDDKAQSSPPEELKPAALMFVDSRSLEPARNESTGELQTVVLDHVFSWQDEWKTDPETSSEMNFFNMPLLTDGNKFYILGRQRCKQPKQSKCFSRIDSALDDSAQSEIKLTLNVLIYDVVKTATNYLFKYERQVVLMKNQFKPFAKELLAESSGVATGAQWATNGSILLCFIGSQLVSFDLATGRKTSKWTCREHDPLQIIHFNYETGNFVRIHTRDHATETSKFWVFNFSNFKVNQGENVQRNELSKMREAL
jgi:hypothetical protein